MSLEHSTPWLDIALSTGLFLIPLIGIMAIAVITEQAVLGASTDFAQALRAAFARWWQVILTQVVLFIILFALFVLCALVVTVISLTTGLIALDAPTGLTLFLLLIAIPVITLVVYYIFAFEAVVLRGRSGKAALNYSKALVKGHWWRVVVLFLVFFASGLAVQSLMRYALNPVLGGGVAVSLLVGVLTSVIGAFGLVTTTILFLNLDYQKQAAAPDTALPQTAS